MPWESITDVPPSIRRHKGFPLTLAQANHWGRIFDALKKDEKIENPAALAWATWNKLYRTGDTEWIKRELSEVEEGFVPPPSGEAPEEVMGILQDAYTSSRQMWHEANPEDLMNEENKEASAKLAWNAVKEAGYSKDEEGKWRKAGEADGK